MCMKHKDNSLQCMIVDLWDDPYSFIVTDSKRDIWIFQHPQSNYWMRLISCIIQTEVWVICQSRRLRQIHVTQTGGLIIYNILCELNSIIVLYIFLKRTPLWVCKSLGKLHWKRTWKFGILWTWNDKCSIHCRCFVDWMFFTNQTYYIESNVKYHCYCAA